MQLRALVLHTFTPSPSPFLMFALTSLLSHFFCWLGRGLRKKTVKIWPVLGKSAKCKIEQCGPCTFWRGGSAKKAYWTIIFLAPLWGRKVQKEKGNKDFFNSILESKFHHIIPPLLPHWKRPNIFFSFKHDLYLPFHSGVGQCKCIVRPLPSRSNPPPLLASIRPNIFLFPVAN